MSKEKYNALVKCEKNDRYFNLYLSFDDKEGKEIKLIVKPLANDKKSLSKLMFKIYKALEK